jgi:hypothetical protein
VAGSNTCSVNETNDVPKTTACGAIIAEAVNDPTPEAKYELSEMETNCAEATPDKEFVARIALNPTSTTEAVPFAENTPIKFEINETFANPWMTSAAGSNTCSLKTTDAPPDNATVHGTKTCSLNTTVDVPTIEHCGTMIAEAATDPTLEALMELTCVDTNCTDAMPDVDNVSTIALNADPETEAVPFAINAPIELAVNETPTNP